MFELVGGVNIVSRLVLSLETCMETKLDGVESSSTRPNTTGSKILISLNFVYVL